jgi:hypothetical protein
MDRAAAISHLKALRERERQLIAMDRPWLSRFDQRKASERHATNTQALALVIAELEGPPRVQVIDTRCPQNFRQESDEYICNTCGLRWDVHEEKPACRRD